MQMHLAESTVQRRRNYPHEIAWVRGCSEFYASIEWRPLRRAFDAKVVPIQVSMPRSVRDRIEMANSTYRLRTTDFLEAAAFVLGICGHRRPHLKPGVNYQDLAPLVKPQAEVPIIGGCYPGCFYYTDSCFRADCKLKKGQRLESTCP